MIIPLVTLAFFERTRSIGTPQTLYTIHTMNSHSVLTNGHAHPVEVKTNGAQNGGVVNGDGEVHVEGSKEGWRKNDSLNGWVVQKFGGTSVGKFAEKIAVDIVK